MRIARRFRAAGGEKLAGRLYADAAAVSADLTCQYLVIPPTPVSADHVAQFGIKVWAAQSLSGAYSTNAYVSQALTGQFSTAGVASQVNRVARRMRATGTLRKIAVATNLPAKPSAALFAVYNIGGTVVADITTTYNVAPVGPGDTWMVGDPFDVIVSPIAAAGAVSITDLSLSSVNRDQICTYNLNGALGSLNPAGIAAVAKLNAAGTVALSSAQLTASRDLVVQYAVIQGVFATYTAASNVLRSVQSDHVGSYSLTGLTPVSEDLVGEYQTLSVVNKNLAASYQVLMTVSRPASFLYSVLSPNAVNVDLLGTYSVGGWVQADASFSWDAGGWVQGDLLAAWRVGDLSASPARFSAVDLTAQLAASVGVAQLTAAIPSAGMTAYRG